ncbi:MAG TPA: hypothetical protein VNT75_07500 [Symbiobacteriaceae bacterium]|nr:hypothetical protein [Symbiobacteriaceae bacterium]
MKRFLSVLAVLMISLSCLTVRPAPAQAAAHWAQADANALSSALGWTVPPDLLNKPISPVAWNKLMALVVGEKEGPATYEENPRRYSLWIYTGGMSKTDTIERQHAIGGLVKLIGVIYGKQPEPVGEVRLSQLADGGQVVDWQRPLVEKAVAASLAVGYPGGEFRPTAPLLFGEAAALAARVLNRFGQAQPVPLSTGPWAPDGAIPVQPNRGGAGQLVTDVQGAQYASALPVVGAPAEGHLWVLLDVELVNQSATESLPLASGVAFSIEDGPGLLYHYEMDRAASAAVGSPFAAPEGVLWPGQSMQGKVAFAVPVGTKGFWSRVDHRLGLAKGKDAKWNGSARVLVGDLPGPERVFAGGASATGDVFRVAGVYATRPEAEAVTAKARARQIPAWIEVQPDGRYAAVVGFRFFEQ